MPGRGGVLADDLGMLSVLVAGLTGNDQHLPDVEALDRAATTAPWALRTLDAFVSHASLRLAASQLFIHHSTLRDRVAALERELGWPIREAQGRLRLHLALAVRRYLLHPTQPWSPETATVDDQRYRAAQAHQANAARTRSACAAHLIERQSHTETGFVQLPVPSGADEVQ